MFCRHAFVSWSLIQETFKWGEGPHIRSCAKQQTDSKARTVHLFGGFVF